jgi:hypothetical protein
MNGQIFHFASPKACNCISFLCGFSSSTACFISPAGEVFEEVLPEFGFAVFGFNEINSEASDSHVFGAFVFGIL